MTFLIQQTLLYSIPLMIVALAGVFAERSGIINLALEGIMIIGAFVGVMAVRILQAAPVFVEAAANQQWMTLQGLELLVMLIAAAAGAIFSLLLSYASINLRADQTIGGTALNLLAPAIVLFLIRIIANARRYLRRSVVYAQEEHFRLGKERRHRLLGRDLSEPCVSGDVCLHHSLCHHVHHPV